MKFLLWNVAALFSIAAFANDITTYQLQANVEVPRGAVPSRWRCKGKVNVTVGSRERDYAYNPYLKMTSSSTTNTVSANTQGLCDCKTGTTLHSFGSSEKVLNTLAS